MDKTEKKKEGSAKKEVKAEAEPDAEDMISTVKSRRLMVLQAKKDKEEHDRVNKGEPGGPPHWLEEWSASFMYSCCLFFPWVPV